MTFALPVFFIGAIYHAACALQSRGRAAVRQERLADPKKVLLAQAVSGSEQQKKWAATYCRSPQIQQRGGVIGPDFRPPSLNPHQTRCADPCPFTFTHNMRSRHQKPQVNYASSRLRRFLRK
ncbi:hypothetical protein [Herbaspirillum sp.]|jgi:hypothetical protein|uniref:hypothetical protein n=1 Tax=Herbaspirillum TaxID=963 RepID=UPI002586A9D1|nr:hypothetical protein [Herbaspirillum sp.]MCP3656336.1 hypothetical protein [Herbaspirillum sp.]MCP3948355.1 hypothetical protein [Herbaspirillum sp.]MCP4031725.1 hypothetical protein [Herbaspirillum sp.]MCP4556687.1 hypothetical protein [Herbaspirillum sp.]